MYIDDLCVPEGDRTLLDDRPPVPTIKRYPTYHNFQDALKWLRACFNAERSLLAHIGERCPGAVKNTLHLFEGDFITTHLMRGLRHSTEVVYHSVISDRDKTDLDQTISECESVAASLRRKE